MTINDYNLQKRIKELKKAAKPDPNKTIDYVMQLKKIKEKGSDNGPLQKPS